MSEWVRLGAKKALRRLRFVRLTVSPNANWVHTLSRSEWSRKYQLIGFGSENCGKMTERPMKLLALCPQQTMSMLISIGIVTVTTTLAFGQAPYSKSGRLVTVVPGIRDEASNVWVALAATITPTTEKWVIHEEGDPKYKNLKDRNLSQVPEDHIITIPANASNEQMKTSQCRRH